MKALVLLSDIAEQLYRILEQHNREFGLATLLYHSPGEAHSDKFSSQETRLLCIWVSRERLRAVRDCTTAPDNSTQFTHGSALHLALRMYKEFRGPGPTAFSVSPPSA